MIELCVSGDSRPRQFHVCTFWNSKSLLKTNYNGLPNQLQPCRIMMTAYQSVILSFRNLSQLAFRSSLIAILGKHVSICSVVPSLSGVFAVRVLQARKLMQLT